MPTFFFELNNHPDWQGPMVLRREPAFNSTKTLVADELHLLNYLQENGLPVPRALTADHDGGTLGGGFIIIERLEGLPRVAEEWGPAAKTMALEMAAILARTHRLDVRQLKAPYGASGESSQQHVAERLENWYQRWVNGRTEPSVALESAYSWMRDNIGCVGPELSFVHGDCNFRNILLDGDRLTALLDWELAHPGHAAEDIAYIKPDIEKIMPWNEFLQAYLANGGIPVSADMIRFFEIWSNVWRTTLAANCYAAFVNGEHRSYLYASVGHNEYYASMDALAEATSAAM